MLFKIISEPKGAHIWVRIFSGSRPSALGLCGDLCFNDYDRWNAFVGKFRLRTKTEEATFSMKFIVDGDHEVHQWRAKELEAQARRRVDEKAPFG